MVALCFIHIFIHMGALNTLGVFMSFIIDENNFLTTTTSFMFSFAGIGAALTGMFITPRLIKKIGPRVLMIFSTIVTVCHMIWYALAHSLWEYYISAVLGGFAIGIGLYAATGAIIGAWFVRNRLTMLGIVSAASSLGSAVLNSVSGTLIANIGYRHTYFILAALVFVVGALEQIGIRNKPSDVGQEPLMPLATETVVTPKELPGLTIKEAVKTPSFYLLFIGGIFGAISWTGVNMFIVTLLRRNYGMPIQTASIFDAVLRICITIALLFSGKIAEKLGPKLYILYVGVFFSIGVLILLLTGSNIIDMLVLLVIAMIFMAAGAANSSANAQILANGIFGPKDFSAIQSYLIPGMNLGLAVSAFAAAPFVSPEGNVLNCFWLFFACALVWMILAFISAAISPYSGKKKSNPTSEAAQE